MAKFFTASIRMLYRDKQALFWALAFPIIFAVIFGLFDFSAQADIRVVVVDSPGMEQANGGLAAALGEVDFFKVSHAKTEAAGKSRIDDDEADMVLVVEPGTAQESLRLRTLYNEGNPQSNQIAFSALKQVVDGMNLQMAGVTEPSITIAKEAVTDQSISYYDFILPGLVAMGIMNVAIAGIAVGISKFREQQILKRILATPARPGNFLGAQVLARLVLAMIQTALILAVGVFVFDANIYGNIIWLFVLAALGNIIFLNIGFAVAGRSKTEDAASGLAQAIALPMMFLSGVFFPTETLPDLMAQIVKLLPLTPLIVAMRKVALDGETLAACGPQLAALGIWVLVSFALARSMFSFAEKDA
jgi:ABC-2 type transport system permease protein